MSARSFESPCTPALSIFCRKSCGKEKATISRLITNCPTVSNAHDIFLVLAPARPHIVLGPRLPLGQSQASDRSNHLSQKRGKYSAARQPGNIRLVGAYYPSTGCSTYQRYVCGSVQHTSLYSHVPSVTITSKSITLDRASPHPRLSVLFKVWSIPSTCLFFSWPQD